ncbi:uncharacterized protein LOC119179854 [Rhipicephalus microplus]|uniref:uncharacterized protein LOC119179854 n=1 Tax=Rhipicephalus microplus TaxID=6941 RepID=UPI003F6BACCF
MAGADAEIRVKLDLGLAVPHREAHNLVWIVVDTAETATVKQFTKLIRAKYGVPKKSELYLDDAWLPPDEPLRILRDKDTVRVVTPAQQPSKPDTEPDDDAAPAPGEPVKKTKKKRKRKPSESSESPEANANDVPTPDEPVKKTKKKRKRESSESNESPEDNASNVFGAADHDRSATSTATTPKQGATPHFPAVKVSSTPFHNEPACSTPLSQSLKGTQGWPVAPADPSLSISLSPPKKKRRPRRKKKKPAEDGAQAAESLSLPAAPRLPSPVASPSLPQTAAVRALVKLAEGELPTGRHVRFGSRSSDDDDDEEEKQVASQQNVQPAVVQPTPCVAQVSQSVSTNQENQLPLMNGRASSWDSPATRSYRSVPPPAEAPTLNAKIPEVAEEHAAASSADSVDAPARQVNYSKYPPLKVPPKPGDVIAFKILELDANYCPNVSDYKEGNVLQHNAVSDFLSIELKRAEAKKTYGGKFELEVPDEGMPPVEKVVSILWTELIDPVVLSS